MAIDPHVYPGATAARNHPLSPPVGDVSVEYPPVPDHPPASSLDRNVHAADPNAIYPLPMPGSRPRNHP